MRAIPPIVKPAQAPVSDSADPFPTLQFDDAPEWQWPMPPGDPRRYAAVPALGTPQPCRIETRTGQCLQGDMLDFDPAKRRLMFRAAPDAPHASLAFANLRRLSLRVPLARTARASGTPKERASAAAQERDYTLQWVGPPSAAPAHAAPITGRTAGHVEASEGLYLFSPLAGDGHAGANDANGANGALCRVFVPRSAYTRCEFGASVEELAARHWIAGPAALLDALARQGRQAVIPLGQSLLALGLLTPAQLERALHGLDGKTPLGEALVGAGLVSRTDLQTALAHKMGYPFVDLQRFALQPQALARLPRPLAISHRMLPLMLDGPRLVAAVDRPGRVLKLREQPGFAAMDIVPALALKSQILQAMNRLAGDGWALDPSQRVSFLPSVY